MNKNMHECLGRQLKEAEAILAEEDIPNDCPPLCSQELPQEDFPEVVLLAALGVRKCHSCKGQILEKKIASPTKICFIFVCRLFEYGDQMHKQCGKYAMEMFIFAH